MKTIHATAKTHMKGFCRVCPICSGNELRSAMVLTGCPDIASVQRDILRPAAG